MKRYIAMVLLLIMTWFPTVSRAEDDIVTQMIGNAYLAQNEIEEALIYNPNYGFEIRCEAMECMIALLTDGRVGSNSEVWNIAEAFGFVYDNGLSLRENADNLYAFTVVRQKWYAADDYDSIASFLNAMEEAINSESQLQEMGVVWSFENDTIDFYFNNEDIPTIVEVLSHNDITYGLTVSELYDLLMQTAQYFEFAW